MAETATRQYVALKRRSRMTQTALDTAFQNLQVLEDELADFLDEYYAQVGREFETLSELQDELTRVNASCFTLPLSEIEGDGSRAIKPLNREIKQFYHEMARECHPDQYQTEYAEHTSSIAELKAELMKTLNAAYARKNLSEMWKVKWELERQKSEGQLDHKQRLNLMKSQHAQMQRALDDMQQRENEIKESAAYQLMQHAQLMEVCGQDFIALVKSRVKRQIVQTHRQLVSARVQTRYWSHVKMGSLKSESRM